MIYCHFSLKRLSKMVFCWKCPSCAADSAALLQNPWTHGFGFNQVCSLKLRQHINNLTALIQSSCHTCQMSVVCTIKGLWGEVGEGGALFEREFTMKESLLLNNQQDTNEVRIKQKRLDIFAWLLIQECLSFIKKKRGSLDICLLPIHSNWSLFSTLSCFPQGSF